MNFWKCLSQCAQWSEYICFVINIRLVAQKKSPSQCLYSVKYTAETIKTCTRTLDIQKL